METSKIGICMRVTLKRSVSVAAFLAATAAFSVSAIAQTSANPQTGAPATGAGTAIPSKAGTERQPMAAPGAKSTGPGETSTPSTGAPMAPTAGAGTAIPSKAGSERQPTAVDGSNAKSGMMSKSREDRKAARAQRKAERAANRPAASDTGTTAERSATGTKK
jgi:hypothetical protein